MSATAPKHRRFVERGAMPLGAPYTEPHHMEFAAICGTCGAVAEITRETLRAHHCTYDAAKAINPRLVCSACGARNGRLAVGHFAEY